MNLEHQLQQASCSPAVLDLIADRIADVWVDSTGQEISLWLKETSASLASVAPQESPSSEAKPRPRRRQHPEDRDGE